MDTTKSISLAQAFAHCASTGSYWFGLIITLSLVAGAIALLIIASKKSRVNPLIEILVVFACVAAIALAIFMRPCDVAANTSEAAAARGHYLGY